MGDYYGKKGCCLTCEEPKLRNNWNKTKGKGCLCTDCKCTKCTHYQPTGKNEGYCRIAEEEHAKAEWRKRHEAQLIDIRNRTKKAYKARLINNKKITSLLWIPKSATKKENNTIKIANWFLEKNNFTEPLNTDLLPKELESDKITKHVKDIIKEHLIRGIKTKDKIVEKSELTKQDVEQWFKKAKEEI